MTLLRITGLIGALGVGLGAFGAHGLKTALEARGMMEIWHTASLYHLLHSVVLLALSLQPIRPRWSGLLFAFGILIFSGSLYLLALTGVKWLGAVTPVGGSLLIAGWFSLFSARPRP